MKAVVSWARLVQRLQPFYPKGEREAPARSSKPPLGKAGVTKPMDSDTLKMVVALLVGAMTLGGAVLTFVNSRLNEATTPEGRHRVILWTRNGVMIASGVVGSILFFFGSPWRIILYGANFIIFIVDIKKITQNDINQSNIIYLSVELNMYISGLVVLLLFYVYIKLIEIMKSIEEFQTNTIDIFRHLLHH